MTLWADSEREQGSAGGRAAGLDRGRTVAGRAAVAGRTRASVRPILSSLAFGFLAFLAVGLAGAGTVRAADPTLAPPVPGKYIYDYGDIFSSHSLATANDLAAHIQASGGGKVVVYTGSDSAPVPDDATLAESWQIDGLLLTGDTNTGQMTVGAMLKSKLSSDQLKLLSDNASPGQQTTASWITSTLARVDAVLGGTHVFDGAGLLDAAGKQHAETAAKNLAKDLNANVYIDISLGGNDPSSAAFFNGAGMSSDLGAQSLVIALAVNDTQIGGYIDSNGDVFGNFDANSPWKSNEIANTTAANGNVQAAVLAAIDAVQKPPLISGDAIPVIIFVVVVLIFSFSAPFVWGPWLIRKIAGTPGPIKGGLPGSAVIQSIADTGVTVSMPGVGAEAPDYKLGLQVTPDGGGATYAVEVKTLVPRIFTPMILPGANIRVMIDPKDPMKVVPDWNNLNAGAPAGAAAYGGGFGGGFGGPSVAPAAASYGAWAGVVAGSPGAATAGSTAVAPDGGMDLNFDPQGNPDMNQVSAIAGAVHSGALPSHTGSAAQILATGTHGTATVTSAMPLGRTVGQVNPQADPATLNDPVWMFTVEVSLAGQTPFPAVFGHRVPLDKLAVVVPGVRLAVAVNQADPTHQVAIDWTKSPLP